MNLLRNEQGQTLLFVILSSALFMLIVLKIMILQFQIEQIKDRSQLYLCMKSKTSLLKRYMRQMSIANRTITTLYPSTKLPPPVGPIAKGLHRGAVLTQNVLHISAMKKLILPKYCSVTQQGSFINFLPYKTRSPWLLRRSFDGSVPLKRKKKKIWLISNSKKIIIEAIISAKSRYQSRPKIKTKEFSKQALLTLKLPFG